MNSLAICGNLLNTKIQTATVSDDFYILNSRTSEKNGTGIRCTAGLSNFPGFNRQLYRDGHFYQLDLEFHLGR